jgi:hypothetical protein
LASSLDPKLYGSGPKPTKSCGSATPKNELHKKINVLRVVQAGLIIVYMDGDNTVAARKQVQSLGESFTAATQKGEEFL